MLGPRRFVRNEQLRANPVGAPTESSNCCILLVWLVERCFCSKSWYIHNDYLHSRRQTHDYKRAQRCFYTRSTRQQTRSIPPHDCRKCLHDCCARTESNLPAVLMAAEW